VRGGSLGAVRSRATPFVAFVFALGSAGCAEIWGFHELGGSSDEVWPVWAAGHGPDPQGGSRMSVLPGPSGGVIAGLTFRTSLEVEGEPAAQASPSEEEVMLVRVSEGGAVHSTFAFGGPGDQDVQAMQRLPSGGFAVLGNLTEGLDLDGSSAPGRAGYLAVFDDELAFVWARTFSSATGDVRVRDLAVDAGGFLYVVGTHESDFEDLPSPAPHVGGFLMKLDPTQEGATEWTQDFAGVDGDVRAVRVAILQGSVVVGGMHRSAFDVDGVLVAKSGTDQDVFLVHLSTDGLADSAPVSGGPSDDVLQALLTTEDRAFVVVQFEDQYYASPPDPIDPNPQPAGKHSVVLAYGPDVVNVVNVVVVSGEGNQTLRAAGELPGDQIAFVGQLEGVSDFCGNPDSATGGLVVIVGAGGTCVEERLYGGAIDFQGILPLASGEYVVAGGYFTPHDEIPGLRSPDDADPDAFLAKLP